VPPREELRHLFPQDTVSTEAYTAPKNGGGGDFSLPPRDDREQHGNKLVTEIQSAEQRVKEAVRDRPAEKQPKGICLDFESDPKFKLQLQSLELLRSGIELRNSRMTEDDVMHGTVFVPEGKVGIFIRKFEAYISKDDSRSGKPKNKNLVESVSHVRLAALESFWTDAGEFPSSRDQFMWWEIWLREATNPGDVGEQFRKSASTVGVDVKPREIRFPERRVLLVYATLDQLASFENLFDILAELRLASTLVGEFADLPTQDQADFIEEAKSRIQPPPTDAPAVCHLDTGINRGHPLLESAISEEHVLSIDPNWTTADLNGHGTEMAGLALYGDLIEVLEAADPVVLQHRLESVKIMPDNGQNDPDLYGEITSQAASRVEIVAPDRPRRVFCLTVTAGSRDEGRPLSWSAAVDQICSGVDEEDSPKRLLLVSAGNTPRDGRPNYPSHNHLHGVEDPAQSWNSVAVGAYTEKAVIDSAGYDGWNPIAEPGTLSPSSRTSLIWPDLVWPLKPDIVMEGGNNAIDPASGTADDVDDLMLLTTRVGPGGAPLLTTSGDTSAATALAARYSAIVWAKYPELWPETVRSLLIHSARWTAPMIEEFPGETKTNLESRIRCYGYGVPNLQRALSSASNAATIIIEDSFQPFDKDGSVIKTKEMHMHALPWPKEVLEELGKAEVRMRVTLSYFIEPNPGRRGWEGKYSYQSHGLRFEVKRPTENEDTFRWRINQKARDEEGGASGSDSDTLNWELGTNRQKKGSIHSDVWTGTGAELAASGKIGIFPIAEWWKFRKYLGRWGQQARYSLIVSIETDSEEIDLYTSIASEIGVAIETEIEG